MNMITTFSDRQRALNTALWLTTEHHLTADLCPFDIEHWLYAEQQYHADPARTWLISEAFFWSCWNQGMGHAEHAYWASEPFVPLLDYGDSDF